MKRVKVETFQSKTLHYVNILPYLVVQNIYPECYYPYRKIVISMGWIIWDMEIYIDLTR